MSSLPQHPAGIAHTWGTTPAERALSFPGDRAADARADLVMMRRQLLNLKALAEASQASRSPASPGTG